MRVGTINQTPDLTECNETIPVEYAERIGLTGETNAGDLVFTFVVDIDALEINGTLDSVITISFKIWV